MTKSDSPYSNKQKENGKKSLFVDASVILCAYEWCLPSAILCAAVDVRSVIQQVLDYAEPAAGARLVQSAVSGVVSVIHLTYSVFQAVQHHFLKRANTEGEEGLMREIGSAWIYMWRQPKQHKSHTRVRRSRRSRRKQSFPLQFLWERN